MKRFIWLRLNVMVRKLDTNVKEVHLGIKVSVGGGHLFNI